MNKFDINTINRIYAPILSDSYINQKDKLNHSNFLSFNDLKYLSGFDITNLLDSAVLIKDGQIYKKGGIKGPVVRAYIQNKNSEDFGINYSVALLSKPKLTSLTNYDSSRISETYNKDIDRVAKFG